MFGFALKGSGERLMIPFGLESPDSGLVFEGGWKAVSTGVERPEDGFF
jgi:hypothetical protein